jgi:hypothetical protein
MNAMDLINAALEAPKTHRMVATYACGKIYTFETRSNASAQSHAEMWRRKINRNLIDRDSGKTVRLVSVDVEVIA